MHKYKYKYFIIYILLLYKKKYKKQYKTHKPVVAYSLKAYFIKKKIEQKYVASRVLPIELLKLLKTHKGRRTMTYPNSLA